MTDAAASSPNREWWRRTPLVLREPRAVFAALRDDDDADVSARAEPVLAVSILAGMATVLASSAAAHLLDDPDYDTVLVLVWAFLGGALYAALLYWGGGLLLHFGVLSLGSHAPYQRSRHVLGFASVPLALSLVLWVPRLALYGGDSFRYGGSDTGSGSAVFGWLEVAFGVWSVALLVLGVRMVEGWTWRRAAGAVAIAAALPALFALVAFGVL